MNWIGRYKGLEIVPNTAKTCVSGNRRNTSQTSNILKSNITFINTKSFPRPKGHVTEDSVLCSQGHNDTQGLLGQLLQAGSQLLVLGFCAHVYFRVCVCVRAHLHVHQRLMFYFSFYFMCVAVLPVCLSVHHMQALPVEVRRGCQVPRDWSYSQLWATMYVGVRN